jgi:hypothetical protein
MTAKRMERQNGIIEVTAENSVAWIVLIQTALKKLALFLVFLLPVHNLA